jgi:hypothetical protein
MDNAILKKRLSTFKSAKGMLKRVSDEVVLDVLRAWENWTGRATDLYRELGLSKMQMAIMIKKGKKLVKSGVIVESEFKELSADVQANQNLQGLGKGIELLWGGDKVIRFYEVEQLLDFLKKVA